MRPITEYLDYRIYLRDFYEARKGESAIFSYRLMASRVKMDVSYLAKVFSGQRHIPENKVEDFIKLCKLADRDAEFFRILVLFSRAKGDAEGRTLFEQLLRLQGTDAKALTPDQYNYYSRWYFTAIRATIGLRKWAPDAMEMGKSLDPEISPELVQTSLDLLTRLGLVQTHGESLELCDKHITTGSDVTSFVVRSFQKEMISLATRSLDVHPKEVRDMSTVTLAMSRGAMDDIRDLLSECRNAICRRVAEDSEADCVYQMNIQLFPLSKLDP
jgi:uncharacterized protein (TIGR02147 family)